MNTLFQKFLLLLTALLLAATQNYSANFCSCAEEIFASACPCLEAVEEEDDCCSEPDDCTETIEFDWGDYLPSQNDFKVSLEGVDLSPNFLSNIDNLAITQSVIASGAFAFAPPPAISSRENHVYAKFVSLQV
ncbi:MAG: hypothetical protein MI807_24605 [Verrucomicrobiales bacterium]|nr:hypothetical protein [Verrucomicrobiales bacterium]